MHCCRKNSLKHNISSNDVVFFCLALTYMATFDVKNIQKEKEKIIVNNQVQRMTS